MARWLANTAFGLVLSLAFIHTAWADEKLPKQMQVGEKRLTLNGEGVRTKAFLELYTAGLYLSKPNSNPASIIAADDAMAIRIKITSGFVSQSSLVDSLEDGFKNGTRRKGPRDSQRDRSVSRVLSR